MRVLIELSNALLGRDPLSDRRPGDGADGGELRAAGLIVSPVLDVRLIRDAEGIPR